MGTNYYLLELNPNYNQNEISNFIEPAYTQRHIGKSSGGWCFSLHVYPEIGITTLKDWKSYIKSSKTKLVIDEYDCKISLLKLYDIIENRSSPRDWETFKDLQNYLNRNNAIIGPNDLLRSKIDGSRCIGHGKGTWDYKIGEFF